MGCGRLLCVVSGTGGAVGIERAGLRVLDVPLPGCQLGPTGNPEGGGGTVTHTPLLHVLVWGLNGYVHRGALTPALGAAVSPFPLPH